MHDKKPLVSSEDYGKDEDTAETLIKKHEVIEKDIIGLCVCACMCVCACACVCGCMRTCLRACVCACICNHASSRFDTH